MAGEGGHDDPLGGARDNLPQRLAYLGLALGEVDVGGIGGVAHHQVNAQLGEAGDGRVVGVHAVYRRLVELEVAGVQHGAGRRANEQPQRVGYGVIDGEEIHAEVAQIDGVAALDLSEFGVQDAVLGQFALDEAQGQLGREDGQLGLVQILEQVGQGAGVVLMAMGDDDGLQAMGVLQQVGVVRQDQIHAGMVVVREHQPGVDDDHVLAVLKDGHVLADAVQAA